MKSLSNQEKHSKHIIDETCNMQNKREEFSLEPVYSEQRYLVLQCFGMGIEKLNCEATLLIAFVHAIMPIKPQ
jgi:hypothetical protein